MKERPKFYVMCKNFNDGRMETYDVLERFFNHILTARNQIKKSEFFTYDEHYNRLPITSKELLADYMKREFMYNYWAKCEWEFIAIDWPCSDSIDMSRPMKIDAWQQLEPNMPVIVDLVWNYIESKIK